MMVVMMIMEAHKDVKLQVAVVDVVVLVVALEVVVEDIKSQLVHQLLKVQIIVLHVRNVVVNLIQHVLMLMNVFVIK